MVGRFFRFCLICLLALRALPLFGESLYAVGNLSGDSPKAVAISAIFEERLTTIIEEYGKKGLLAEVNSEILKRDLAKFGCLEEQCMLRFAADAGIGLFITAALYDRGSHILLEAKSFGTDFPFYGREIYSYSAEIAAADGAGSGRYELVFEEHAARFVCGIFSALLIHMPVNGLMAADLSDGEYWIFRKPSPDYEAPAPCVRVGKLKISGTKVEYYDYTDRKNGDFVLADYKKEAQALKNRFIRRKRELVFEPMNWESRLYTALLVPVGSASMPVLAPFLGYFPAGDWPGLALFALNALPYIYLEADGFINNPGRSRKHGKDISRRINANWCFAWYMLAAGGGSLFVDAFAGRYLQNASEYMGGSQPFMGSDFVAGFLALTTAGGGHFYRGSRFWGYVYFHAVNLLVYFVIRDFVPAEYKNPNGSYTKGPSDKKRGGLLIGALGAVKLTEFIHALLTEDRIRNGRIIEDRGFSVEPSAFVTESRSLSLGLSVSFRF